MYLFHLQYCELIQDCCHSPSAVSQSSGIPLSLGSLHFQSIQLHDLIFTDNASVFRFIVCSLRPSRSFSHPQSFDHCSVFRPHESHSFPLPFRSLSVPTARETWVADALAHGPGVSACFCVFLQSARLELQASRTKTPLAEKAAFVTSFSCCSCDGPVSQPAARTIVFLPT